MTSVPAPKQPTLFDRPAAARGSRSSAAGARVAAKSASTKRQRVLDCITNSPGGLTRAEIAVKTDIPLATVCSCVHTLIRLKAIGVSIETRRSASGVNVEVLTAGTNIAAPPDEVARA